MGNYFFTIFNFRRVRHKLSEIYTLLLWTLVAGSIASLIGLANAFFLYLLEWAGRIRSDNLLLVLGLPLVGIFIVFVYRKWGSELAKGNNLILENINQPKKTIPFKMAPFILFGTVLTHLFGGSAGREGTAIQIGASISDQFHRWVKLGKDNRKMLLICGMSAGFGSVFGTPFAGAIFGLEVYNIGKIKYGALFPAFISSVVGDYVCRLTGAHHSHYFVANIPSIDITNLFYVILVGLCCGFAAFLFSHSVKNFSFLFKKYLKYWAFIPVVAALMIIFASIGLGTSKYLGLGLETISASFTQVQGFEVFALKLLFTAITLSAGFKGGEVTPLFFIGASLGSALSLFIPLPVSLLAAMGFVAVFAGASNTPLASSIMGLELFGMECAPFVAIACIVAYIASGHNGIYSAQLVGEAKYWHSHRGEGKTLQ